MAIVWDDNLRSLAFTSTTDHDARQAIVDTDAAIRNFKDQSWACEPGEWRQIVWRLDEAIRGMELFAASPPAAAPTIEVRVDTPKATSLA